MANQGASSSSAHFTKSWKYHVFLSFRGFDTRSNFTSHLYSALRQQGINTFMDDDELRRGEEISNALLTAIEDSKISVVVFSENYASSKWCLDELVKILDCKESNQQLVIPVFYKVDPSDVRNQTGSFGNALAHLESKYKDNMDKVHRWRAALSQAGKLAGFPLSDSDHRESEAEFIQKIIKGISAHVIDRTYLKVAEHLVGMQPHVQDMNKILDLGEKDVRMVGVWGTGGIGKTTIAKVVYNSIAHEFEGSCFLENVRERSTSHEGSVGLQENLLSDILRGTKLKVPNVHIGATMIQERLSCRKVLLVLDDVNDMEQLHKLAGACDWFGVGSRIIITTRDKQLLTAHYVNLIHEVKILDDDEAMELFSWHAFKRRGPPLGDYVKLTERAIGYAQGLPLALTVLGSCLCGGTIDKWEAALHGFKSTKIQDVLKISYNALDDRVKQVFLDLACFFKGESTRYAIETLEACDLNPRYGIQVLIEKALITVQRDYIQMHDLLEEMGKDIVEQESPTEPGERSRLWGYENIKHVLTNDTGTNKITGIMLNSPQKNDEIFLDVDCFSKMKNLKIFINRDVCLYGDIGYLPNTVRVLDWYRFPLQSFPPNFRPKKLVVLNMPYNRIKQPERLLKHLPKLKYLNLSHSEFLTEIPDLSCNPNLKFLDASYCTRLVEVHPSVGYLEKLEVLDFRHCPELRKFPKEVRLKSLKRFLLSKCKKFESFPKIVDKIESMCELKLEGTAIKELPSSIGYLTGLKKFNLAGTAIKELPSSIGYLTGLKKFNLAGTTIKELPSSIGHLIALEVLNLEGCENLTNLPQSIYRLQHLKSLNLSRCSKLVTLPFLEVLTKSDSVGSLAFPELRIIRFAECNLSDIDSLENFGCSSKLWRIDLPESNFVRLPVCISKFVKLSWLDLRGCKRLGEIVELPLCIETIDLGDCTALKTFSTLEDGDTQLICEMNLSNCHRLCNNLGLDASKMTNILLNQMKKFPIEVILPGSTVPEWFSCSEDDEIATDDDIRELVIEIPQTFKWENTRLVLCAVLEITEAVVDPCSVDASVTIDGVRVNGLGGGWLRLTDTKSAHVWLKYIPLPVDMQPEGGDRKSNQLKPYVGRVTFYLRKSRGLLFKSCGVHLAHRNKGNASRNRLLRSRL